MPIITNRDHANMFLTLEHVKLHHPEFRYLVRRSNANSRLTDGYMFNGYDYVSVGLLESRDLRTGLFRLSFVKGFEKDRRRSYLKGKNPFRLENPYYLAISSQDSNRDGFLFAKNFIESVGEFICAHPELYEIGAEKINARGFDHCYKVFINAENDADAVNLMHGLLVFSGFYAPKNNLDIPEDWYPSEETCSKAISHSLECIDPIYGDMYGLPSENCQIRFSKYSPLIF